jgi:tetratricopeptide (TPR) repeat protein
MKHLKILALLSLLLNGFAGPASAQDHYPQYMQMAKRAFDNQKYELAVSYYESAIDDKSEYWQAYVGLGNCYYYLKRYKDSLKNYEKALQMNPNNPNLLQFIQFLKTKMGVVALPTPTPTPTAPPPSLPAGLPPLPQ